MIEETCRVDVKSVLKLFVLTNGFPEISMGCPLMEETQRSVVLTLKLFTVLKFKSRLWFGLGALVTPVRSSAILMLLTVILLKTDEIPRAKFQSTVLMLPC